VARAEHEARSASATVVALTRGNERRSVVTSAMAATLASKHVVSRSWM
jgi:hypothetical protein